MSINWIEYPRPGTSVGEGRWLCTVFTPRRSRVEFLNLIDGDWYFDDDQPLTRAKVIAIAYVPEPYTAPRKP